MALKPCKECKREISTEAKTCPHCGKKSPTSRAGSLGLILVAVLVLSVFAALSSTPTPTDNASPPPATAPAERPASRRDQALAQTKIEFTWRKGGFETAMIADFVITNASPWRIKDLEVTCEHFGPSGTKIDSNVRTIYEIVEPKSTKHINEFNMGMIRSQVSSSSCAVTNLVLA